MVTEGNACGAIPWILLGLPMVDTARFQGLHYNHGPTGRAFGSFAAIMWPYCDGGDRDDRKGRPYAFWGITP